MRINKFFVYCFLLFVIFSQFDIVSNAASLESQILQNKIFIEYKKGGLEKAEAEYKAISKKNNLKETDIITLLNIYDKNSDDDKYLQLCNDGIRNFPSSYTIYCLLGMKYSSLKRYDEAIAAFSASIKIHPAEPAYYNRGQIYYYIKKDNKKAVSDFSEAIKYIGEYSNKNQANRAIVDIYKHRSLAYKQLEKYDNAISDLNASISYSPEDADLYYNRAVIKIAKARSEKFLKRKRNALMQSAEADLNKASDIYQKNNNMIMYKRIQDYKNFEALQSIIK